MRTVHIRFMPALLMLATIAGCTPPDEEAARTAAPTSPRLVERLEMADSGQQVSLATVDGRLRYAHEIIRTARGTQAENTWLYFEELPVYYRSTGSWPEADKVEHSVFGWAEFSVSGGLLGLEKRLDNERIPVNTGEPAAIYQRGLDLFRQARPLLGGRDGCEYNKSLRWNNRLVTLSTGSDACGPGQLQVFLQVPEGTRSQSLERIGTINDSWFHDFDSDGEPELLIEFEDPRAAQSLLTGWRIHGNRLEPLDLRAPGASDREKYQGDRYYVHGDTLIRRYPKGESPEGLPLWERLEYDWRMNRWVPAEPPARSGIPAEISGQWSGSDGSLLRLETNGSLTVTEACGEAKGTALGLPGDILLVSLTPAGETACPENALQNSLPGYWLAEQIAGRLRLASLEGAVERSYESAGFAGKADTL